MPSQQLPKSSKVETLPDDLKAIAERLIRDKFGFKVKHEPELMENKNVTREGTKTLDGEPFTTYSRDYYYGASYPGQVMEW